MERERELFQSEELSLWQLLMSTHSERTVINLQCVIPDGASKLSRDISKSNHTERTSTLFWIKSRQQWCKKTPAEHWSILVGSRVRPLGGEFWTFWVLRRPGPNITQQSSAFPADVYSSGIFPTDPSFGQWLPFFQVCHQRLHPHRVEHSCFPILVRFPTEGKTAKDDNFWLEPEHVFWRRNRGIRVDISGSAAGHQSEDSNKRFNWLVRSCELSKVSVWLGGWASATKKWRLTLFFVLLINFVVYSRKMVRFFGRGERSLRRLGLKSNCENDNHGFVQALLTRDGRKGCTFCGDSSKRPSPGCSSLRWAQQLNSLQVIVTSRLWWRVGLKRSVPATIPILFKKKTESKKV